MNEIAIEEKRETKTYLEYCDEIIIKDNVSAGDWEWDMLANEWDSVQLNDFGLDVWENEDDKVTEGLIEDDVIPEVKESKVKRGDIWQLGEHRVMCGDSTSSDDVAKLMNGEKADMVFTDPPYGVSASGGRSQTVERDGIRKIANDELRDDNLKNFISSAIAIIPLKENGSFYICYDQKTQVEFISAIKENNWIFKKTLVWNKNVFGLSGHKGYRPKYELIAFGFIGKEYIWYGDNSQADVIDIARPRERFGNHPTPKPTELIEVALINSSKKSDIIMDSFLGSGSTLIAAEKLNRKCYGMELDEKYCDVIINRWEQFTGLKATIINGTK
jgi:site-specific DNA-methyltransferase (adenine-specific)